MNGRVRGKSDVSLQSRDTGMSKENHRASIFFNNVTGRGRTSSMDEKDDTAMWVTSSNLTDGSNDIPERRSSSSQRAETTISVGSRVGSVRKRLSMLKLGKKTSKASVMVDSVAEE
jgi:dedicator of cytokinesis protein 3